MLPHPPSRMDGSFFVKAGLKLDFDVLHIVNFRELVVGTVLAVDALGLNMAVFRGESGRLETGPQISG